MHTNENGANVKDVGSRVQLATMLAHEAEQHSRDHVRHLSEQGIYTMSYTQPIVYTNLIAWQAWRVANPPARP